MMISSINVTLNHTLTQQLPMYMKVKTHPLRNDPIALAYSGQYGGASLPFYVGKQYGMGWLRTLARFVFPVAKRALGMVGNVAANTAEDLINQRKSFKESIKDNAIAEATNLLASGVKRKKSSSINKPKKIKKQHTIFSRN